MAWNDWLKKGAKAVGNFAYDVTGADNYMQSWRDLKKGNIGGAFFNLAQGLGETALLAAPAVGTGARAATLAARAPKIFRGAQMLTGLGGGLRGVGTNLAWQAGGRALGGLGGTTTSPQSRPTVPQASAADFRIWEERQKQQTQGGTTPTPSGGGSSGGLPAAPTPKYEKQLPAIDPALMQQLQAARGTAGADYRALLNMINAEDRASSIATQNALRQAGAGAARQAQDLGSSLSEMGYSMAPAQMDVGAEAIRQQEAQGRAAAQQGRTASLADFLQRRTAGSRRLAEELARLQALETGGRVQAAQDAFNMYFGGK